MINLPAIKVFVGNQYLMQKGKGFTAGYLATLDARPNSYLRFTVYLESGALWSGLPIEALTTKTLPLLHKTNALQPFSCLEGPASVCEIELLKHAKGLCFNGTETFNYLFTINYQGTGLADDPQQYKTHNIVEISNGQLAAMPNNYLWFSDNWLFDEKKAKEKFTYKRSAKRYEPGG